MTTREMGQEGFRWFFGIVEDVADPLQLGRVKVRVYNEHDDGIETDSLPWAHVMLPTTSPSVHGIGDTPSLSVGSNIIGFFIDSQEKQMLMIIGSYPIIPDMEDDLHSISYLARGKQTIEKEAIGPEPATAYGAEYPYNRVLQTRSGHVVEYDDTPENERIHIYHKSGSYIEMNADGSVVVKSSNDKYDIVAGNQEVFIKGNANIKVEGTCDIHANQAASISSDVGLKIKAPGGVTVTDGAVSVKDALGTDTGATGTFTSATGLRINVQNGIVTSIG